MVSSSGGGGVGGEEWKAQAWVGVPAGEEEEDGITERHRHGREEVSGRRERERRRASPFCFPLLTYTLTSLLDNIFSGKKCIFLIA